MRCMVNEILCDYVIWARLVTEKEMNEIPCGEQERVQQGV
jgi:hypothetical protein